MDRDKDIKEIFYNHLNLPTKIYFRNGGEIEYIYDASGVKIKKEVNDGTQINTTLYRDGFQYYNNILEFFPHSEGYVKATEAVNGYIFNYVFTHTDHLGNIRVKYTKHPQTGDIQILEEDHYYPYGLTHEGYNGNHRIVGLDQPGTAITLIDVTPDVTDPYKYKFNGMEWQDEFDVNMYDFGARNYDPALGRWMNIDPLAEMMRRHSPYNYAFNNPVYFIDPDGMSPIPGALKSGLLVQDTNFLGVSDISNGNMGSTASGESIAPEQNNTAAYKDYFQQVSDYAANADESLGGGCPDGDCDEAKKSVVWKDQSGTEALEILNTVTSTTLSGYSAYQVNNGKFRGASGRYYTFKNRNGWNQYTGTKTRMNNTLSKAKWTSRGASALGVINYAPIIDQRQEIGNAAFSIEMTSNTISTFTPPILSIPWTIGYEGLGRNGITRIPWYQNTFKPWVRQKLGLDE